MKMLQLNKEIDQGSDKVSSTVKRLEKLFKYQDKAIQNHQNEAKQKRVQRRRKLQSMLTSKCTRKQGESVGESFQLGR